MPVEETGNMLLLVAAVAQADGNAEFASRYWPTLTKWAQYLEEFGRDPENQLCTDDFAGHLGPQREPGGKSNLRFGSLWETRRDERRQGDRPKILGYGKRICPGLGQTSRRRRPFPPGLRSAQHLELQVQPRLGQDPGSASVPGRCAEKEMAFYRKNIDRLAWRWTGGPNGLAAAAVSAPHAGAKPTGPSGPASLTDDPQDFAAITNPIYDYFSQSPRRVGLADLYFTDRPTEANMHSRPVIGGIFIKMLYDQAHGENGIPAIRQKPKDLGAHSASAQNRHGRVRQNRSLGNTPLSARGKWNQIEFERRRLEGRQWWIRDGGNARSPYQHHLEHRRYLAPRRSCDSRLGIIKICS